MNKVILVGNLTRDPELITTNNGISLCRFTLAVQRKYSSNEGEREADFINIVVWRAAADNCYKYLKKGSKAGVVGSMQTRSYDAQDGSKRYTTDVVADEVEFISTTRSNGEGDFSYEASESRPSSKKETAELEEIDDDSLPF